MSSATPPIPAPAQRREIKLVGHSPLFYFWPIWALGFFLAGWTYFENNRMAVVPDGVKISEGNKLADDIDYILRVSAKTDHASLDDAVKRSQNNEPAFPTRLSKKAWMGPSFAFVLILTILITSVPMRGLWSFLVIILLVVVALVFSLLNVWDDILQAVGNLHIHINMAGYLFIGTVLFIIWAFTVLLIDQRTYITFTPGQIRVCEHVGDAVRNFDTTGMTFEKQRDDLFRHIILGFGSGDLIVRTSGAERQEFKLMNVFGIGWKLDAVQELLREKAVTAGGDVM